MSPGAGHSIVCGLKLSYNNWLQSSKSYDPREVKFEMHLNDLRSSTCGFGPLL